MPCQLDSPLQALDSGRVGLLRPQLAGILGTTGDLSFMDTSEMVGRED